MALRCSVLILILILVSFAAHAATGSSAAPDFTLKDLGGKNVSLSDFGGKVVVLNFWSTICGPCRAEMPSLNALYLDFRDRGFVVLSVSIDASEKAVASFMTEKKYAFPVLMDKDKEVYFDTYGAVGLPVTFLISRKGVIVEKIMGERKWDSPQMKDKILKLLEER